MSLIQASRPEVATIFERPSKNIPPLPDVTWFSDTTSISLFGGLQKRDRQTSFNRQPKIKAPLLTAVALASAGFRPVLHIDETTSHWGDSYRSQIISGYSDSMTGKRSYMERQVALFMGSLAGLLPEYEGRYIAFEDGRVLAVGDGISSVLSQVRERYHGKQAVLVRKVQREYRPIEL